MAVISITNFVFTLLVFPAIASAYRPFDIPKNLFTSGLKDAHLPEGARQISWRQSEDQLQHSGEEQNFSKRRARRDASIAPEIIESDLPAEPYDSTIFMNWGGDKIILLAKGKKTSIPPNVYLSSDFGKKWSQLNSKLNRGNVIDQIYVSKVKPSLCILTDIKNKFLYVTKDYLIFKSYGPLSWQPSYIAFHPTDSKRIMGYDKVQKKLFLSVNGGSTFQQISDNVRTFWWGVPGQDGDKVVYVDKIKTPGANAKYRAVKFDYTTSTPTKTILLDDIDEFEVMENYMFATKTLSSGKIVLKVSYNRKDFKDTKFPVTENNRDYFVFDIIDDQVFIVINHFKNESNLYLSDVGGVKYTLSLPRVLYHNPYTDVSSAWLRSAVPYAFVDVYKIKSMSSVYVATQLTPGPVGRRHLLSMITYNKGASWGRIRSPTRDTNGMSMYCYLPSCSLHFNLKYGSVYRIAPSENLMSSKSAPGLVLGLGVASTNLKIHPDMFVSTDGGVNWKRALRGKYQYSFGNFGSAIVASYFKRHTTTLRYSTDGGDSFKSAPLPSKSQVLIHDIVTQNDEKQPLFLMYGTPYNKQPWKVYHVNMTKALGRPCQKSDFMSWVPSGAQVGMKRCELGSADNYTIRNWTTTCYLNEDHSIPKVRSNCPCTIDDFECDFGFVRNASHFICVPVAGEDLDSDLIPDNCPEGTTYKRSIGYRKIPGDKCVGGEEKNFLPKDTPCPMKKLSGLNVVTTPDLQTNGVTSNSPVTFAASLMKGYLPNVNFGWDFGDGSVKNGTGKSFATVSHSFANTGRYTVVLTATNTRSILIKRIEVNVEQSLTDANVKVSFHPYDPSVAQTVAFMTSITGLSKNDAGSLMYKWAIDGKEVQNDWQPSYKTVFNSSKVYLVTVDVKNSINSVKKTLYVKVNKDIRPLNVKAAPLGPAAVEVTWDLPLEPTRYIRGFKVFKSKKRQSDYQECAPVGSSTTSYLVNGLTPSTTYYFKVLAFTKDAEGAFSDIASAVTNDSSPGSPVDLHAYPLSSTSIRVAWKAPDNDYGRITSYVINWSAAGQSTSKAQIVDRSTRHYDFVKLMQDTEYTFEVIAKFPSGQSFAGPVQAKSNISKPVLPPRGVVVLSNNGTCVGLVWIAPLLQTGSLREFPAKGYKIYLSGQLRTTVNTKYATICNLIPGNSYDIEVSAYSVAGEGPKAKTMTVKMVSIKSSPPTNFRGSAMTPREIQLRWDPPLSSNGEIKNYVIHESNRDINFVAYKSPYMVTGLEPYTKYEYTIFAVNQAGDSKPTPKIAIITHEEIPSPPRYVQTQLVDPMSASIQLTWSPPVQPNGKITGYQIVWGKTSITDERYNQKKKEIIGNKMEYTFNHLYSNTEYTFMVAAKNGAGRSISFSNHSQRFTLPALDGTMRLRIAFQGKHQAGETFDDDFINAVSRQAKIDPTRVAALNVQPILVDFDLLPSTKSSETKLSQAVVSLNNSFSVGSERTVTGSLRVLHTYSKNSPIPTSPSKKGDVGAQVSARATGEKKNLALIIVLTLVGLLLLVGLIFAASFYYRKYKPLEKHYNNMSSIYRTDEDEANIVYPVDMSDEPNGRDHSLKSKKNTKSRQSEEKMPLGEHDELAMV